MFKKKEIKRKLKQHIENTVKFGTGIKHLTILFSDIWSITSLAEMYGTHKIMVMLNEYFTEMENVINRYNGTIDKFIGDEIMAEFGIPTHLPDHAEVACLAALEMVRSFDVLNTRWMQDSKATLSIQIGIHTGDMYAGYIGSKQRLEYTVIGHEVTRGVRLMGINKVYQTSNHIIISEFTKNELSDKIVTRELDNVRLKGLTKPQVIFDLVGEKDDIAYSEEFLAHYNRGLALYKKMQFKEALVCFKKALEFEPADGPTKLYISRCIELGKNPPSFV